MTKRKNFYKRERGGEKGENKNRETKKQLEITTACVCAHVFVCACVREVEREAAFELACKIFLGRQFPGYTLVTLPQPKHCPPKDLFCVVKEKMSAETVIMNANLLYHSMGLLQETDYVTQGNFSFIFPHFLRCSAFRAL